ncbi:MAG: hypothetical protein RLZZ612_1426 [Pseudomonadota bacterium]
MATLIPALGACVSRMTSGERRLAERLQDKLDQDYLLWYDVPVGTRQLHPDFLVLHPSRGLLILEVKDWKLDTLRYADKQTWTIVNAQGQPKTVVNPMEQARQYAHQVVQALERDPPLVRPEGRQRGKLAFPWSYGVVFTHLSRRQFLDEDLAQVLEPHRVLCRDDITESISPEDLQSRLWEMFPYMMQGMMSEPQLDRVRWILFPQIRLPVQGGLSDPHPPYQASEPTATSPAAIASTTSFSPPLIEEDLPSLMRVMDLQQEQLARSLGDGHRVIHGVAGSGKTLILGYRAEHLAKAATAHTSPVLVLCFNKALAQHLQAMILAKGVAHAVQVRHFHRWCREQLIEFAQPLPHYTSDSGVYFENLVQNFIQAVEMGHIPSGRYRAVLIDEGHDFAPHWLKLAVQMVDPRSNQLLVVFDDAQKIYAAKRRRRFSLKSVGIQAQGRTTILKINYRNTRQVLELARAVAAEVLEAEASDDDGIPLIPPISCGREGPAPVVLRFPHLRDEAFAIAHYLRDAHKLGHAWGDMAILCRDHHIKTACANALRHHKLPHRVVGDDAHPYTPHGDAIHLLTMHASKGLEFPLVALPGVGLMPLPHTELQDEARLFYVAATRATHQLLITLSGDGALGHRLDAFVTKIVT